MSPPSRHGFTLLDLLVGLAICAITLAILARVAATEQQILGAVSDRASGRIELQVVAGGMPVDLRALGDPGDIPQGQARDTSLQFRETIATSIVCDSAGGVATLVPEVATSPVTSHLRQPEAGDTAWVLDSTRVWQPIPIADVAAGAAGQCAPGAPRLNDAELNAPRIGLALIQSPVVAPGAPIRITRPMRYSIYRSADRAWYLGARDWNPSTAKFNTIQPVAGPLLPPASHGLAFAYMDRSGSALPTPVTEMSAIAAIRLTVLAPARRRVATHARGATVDTARIVVRLRTSRQ